MLNSLRINVTFLGTLGADLLSLQKLLAAILLQKKSIMQVLAANILMKISIKKLSVSVF